jgi:hypothetical protein
MGEVRLLVEPDGFASIGYTLQRSKSTVRGRQQTPSPDKDKNMSGDIKKYALMGAVVLITLFVYNSFLKSFVPTSIRAGIGLG